MQHSQAMVGARQPVRARSAYLRSSGFQTAIRTAQVASDAMLVWLSFWLAYQARYMFEIGGKVRVSDFESFGTFEWRDFLLVGLTLLVFVLRGLYRLPLSTGFLDEATMVVGGLTTAMAGVILTAFLSRFVPSRLVFIYAWVIAVVLLLARRGVSRWIRNAFWARNLMVNRVLVVGAGESGRRIIQAMMTNPALGYRVVGFVDDTVKADAMSFATARRLGRADRLGSIADLGSIVGDYDIDQVVVALSGKHQEQTLSVIEQCRQHFVRFMVVPNLLQLSLDRVELDEVAGIPLIGLRDASIRGLSYAVKRSMDIMVASVVLTLMGLPMAIIAAMIRLDSPGPILIRQMRIGRDGVPFTLIKFRCMVRDAEEQRQALLAANPHIDPRLFKLKDDPRLTRVGRILRHWSLDELPQFVHVIRGQMSIVGPRPQLPEEVAGYEEWHKQRLLVTPGLTGLWQVSGRSQLTFDDMVRLDLFYAEHWSLWLDLKIALRTIPAVLRGHGAY